MNKRQAFTQLFQGLLVLILVSLLATPLWGQALGSGQIEGVVTDESGAVIPGAKVTVRSLGTGATRELVTGADGRYSAISLTPAQYSVTVEMAGFATAVLENVTVVVGSTTRADAILKVSATAATITVSDVAPITEPEKIEVAQIVGQQAVENLPINGRRWDNFVLLTPGVAQEGTFGLISWRGISGLYNNNQVDGTDNNQAFFSEARGRTRAAYSISQSAVREFQVGLSNFSAEFGRAAGGTVNAVTRSGSNDFHGEVFYFIRDDVFKAREPTLPLSESPKDRRQQFGFSMGGPIIKNKLFFFLNYDQQLRSEQYFVQFSSATFVTQSCTAPGCAATLAFLRNESTLVPRKRFNNIAFGKLDWIITPKHTFTGQYNWHRWKSPNGIRTPVINFNAGSDNGTDIVKTDVLIFKLNSILTNSVLNEARFQFARDFEEQRPNALGPGTSVTGAFSFGMPNFLPRPKFPDEKRFQWIDNISWMRGKHTFKFGADINYVRDLQVNLFQGGGVYSYASLQALAQDCPIGAIGCVQQATGATTGRHYSSYNQAFDLRGLGGQVFFTTWDVNFFVQDTWKVVPSLTLNLGLRYELQRLPQPDAGNPQFPLTTNFNQDTNNFGPRVGLAWDVGGKHKLVVRAGYGLYYARTSNSAASSALLNNGTVLRSFFFTPSTTGAPAYPSVFTAPPTGTSSTTIQFFSPDYVRPMVHMAELGLEYELMSNLSVSATYLFTRGQRLPTFRDTNINPPNATATIFLDADGSTTTTTDRTAIANIPFYSGARPIAGFSGLIMSESVINSRYNALVVQVNQRAKYGLTLNANYTWAKSLDDDQGSTTFFGSFTDAFDPFNRHLEYGRSDVDLQHRFVSSFLWRPSEVWKLSDPTANAILGDWGFGGVVTLHTGQTVDAQMSGSISSSITGATVTSTINGTGGSFRVPFLGRNPFETPGFATVDFRVSKDFRITETKKVRFIWEAFNLFNRVNSPSRFNLDRINFRVLTSLASVGTDRRIVITPNTGYLDRRSASGTLFGPREMQFAVKFIW